MRKKTIWTIGALLTAALLFAVVRFPFGGDSNRTREEVARPSAAAPSDSQPGAADQAATDKQSSPSTPAVTSARYSDRDPIGAAPAASLTDGSNLEDAHSNNLDVPDAVTQSDDVRDHPFVVSESVDKNCTRSSTSDEDFCEKEHKLLARLAQEARDKAWAPDMENTIRAFVASEGDKFRVRSIECRTSLCAVEIESAQGPYLGIGYRREKESHMHDDTAVFGYERGEGETRITVTLRILERA